MDYSLPHYWVGWVHQLFIHCLPRSSQLALGSALSSSASPSQKKSLKIQVSIHTTVHFSHSPLSLSPLVKEKSQHISTGTAVALIWGIFCKTSHFKVFVGCKLLIFRIEKEKLMLKNKFQTKWRCYSWFFGGIHWIDAYVWWECFKQMNNESN